MAPRELRRPEMKKPWWAVAVLAVLLATLTLLVLYSGPSPSSLVIGAMMPLTGDNAVYGRALRQGMQVAVAEINTSGGVNGRPLQLIYEDTQANPQLGVTAFQKLVDVDKCHLVLGGMFSAVTLAVAPLAERSHVVLLSPTSSAVELSTAGDYVFRIYPSDTFDGINAADFSYTTLGARRAAVLPLQVASTVAIAKVFQGRFVSLGGAMVFIETHKEGEVDFRVQLRRLAEAKPDVVFLPSYLNEMARLLRQHKELGMSQRILSISTFNDPAILNLAGDAAEGVIFSTPFFDPAAPDPLTSAFVAAYSSAYRESPNIWAGYGYDAVRVAAKALAGLGARPSGDAIRDALYAIEDFPGVTGNVTFDSNGDVAKDLRMMVVSDGAFKPFAMN
jgi:branched-chain amino acid transport system substrate-binding protein